MEVKGVVLENKTKKELIEYASDNKILDVNLRMNKAEIINILESKAKDIERNNIRSDLLDQLERNGIYGMHYTDLVSDYMEMWQVKNKLIDDIKGKGVSVKYQNGENQWGYKKNDSVGELNRTNNQMIKLLEALGLKANNFVGDKIDKEDLEM